MSMNKVGLSGPAAMQLRAAEITGKVVPGTQGQIATHTVEVGEGAHKPSKAAAAGKAFVNFFKGIGDAFSSLKNKIEVAQEKARAKAEAKADAKAEAKAARAAEKAEAKRAATFEKTRGELQGQLPSGVEIDDEGVISGKHYAVRFPDASVPHARDLFGADAGKTVESILERDCRKELAKPPTVVKNVSICSLAKSDLSRGVFTIHNGGTPYRSTNDPAVEDKKAENVALQLDKLTNHDRTATHVLSSVTNQLFGQIMMKSWTKDDGTIGMCQLEQKRGGGTAPFRENDGNMIEVEPHGMGNGRFDIKKEGGDYKVSISWEAFYKGAGVPILQSGAPFAGMGDSLIRTENRLEIIVDGAAASAGRLEMRFGAPAEVQFFGRMADVQA